jgi:hypothetical protein
MMFFATTRRLDSSGALPGSPERPATALTRWGPSGASSGARRSPACSDPLPLVTFVAGLAHACATSTAAQQERNNARWTAARSCENGSLSVVPMSSEGVPYTQTVNSSGGELAPFEKCYQERAAPIWGAYCKAEPDSPQCRR